MTTTADLINETKRYLLSTHREQLNQLNGAIDNSQTTMTLSRELGSIDAGAILSIDLEILYVWSVDRPTKVATVQRGFLGSAAASHGNSSLVTINPHFPDFSILQALNAELHDLSSSLFQVKEVSFTYVVNQVGYNLTGAADVSYGIECRYDYPGPNQQWPRVSNWIIKRDSDTTDFPSGFAVNIYDYCFPGRDVRVTYATGFDTLSALTDNVLTVTGLPTSAHDIPPLGAAVRLQAVREGQRNFNEAQPDPRRAQEVVTGAQLTSVRGLMDIRRTRILSESRNQTQQYPNRRKVM